MRMCSLGAECAFSAKTGKRELKRILFVPKAHCFLRSVSMKDRQYRGLHTVLCWKAVFHPQKRRDKDMQYVIAFVTGGMICALSQILMEKTKMLPGRIMVLLVCLGAILGFVGIYEPFSQWAQAGAMCRFWDLETISGRVSKRWWTRKVYRYFSGRL